MLDYPALAALSAVLELGSFERAAARLHVTPSAVSQRVRQLEERVGAPLIVRGPPATATPVGARLARHADEVGLLEASLRHELAASFPGGADGRVSIAVNADSLATWFADVLVRSDPLLFDLVVEDETRTAEALRRGEVSAAVTANPVAEAGCRIEPLGTMRYRATASPAYLARRFPNGVDRAALARAPMCTFDPRDRLQERWLRERFDLDASPPTHYVPSSEAFVRLALAGVAWGMNPAALVDAEIARGALVELVPGSTMDVPLHWQTPRVLDGTLDALSDAVREVAAAALVPPDA